MDHLLAIKNKLMYQTIAPAIVRMADMPYAIIKGEALSIAAYNEPGRRNSSDVDILVSKDNVRKMEKAFKEIGFFEQREGSTTSSRYDRIFLMSSSHQTVPLCRQNGIFTVCVDINFDIFWGEYTGGHPDINSFLNDCRIINIYGLNVKTLPPVKAMIQLCLHHYKDLNSVFLLVSKKKIQTEMFKDVYYLLKNNRNEISPEKLADECKIWGAAEYVYYILYYTAQLFNDGDLERYIDILENKNGIDLLNCYGLATDGRHEWKVDFKTRIGSENIFELMKEDLSEDDLERIKMNRRVFVHGKNP